MGLPTHTMPCCMANTHIDTSVDCLSPEGSDDTVKPAASLFLSCCVFHSRPVASMKVLNGPDTPPRYVGEPRMTPS
ncbi:hypothetical protein D3C72_2066270 [compost metagenome]